MGESAKGSASIMAVIPVMFLLMPFILMLQLHSTQRLPLVMLAAPLAIIGVTLALLFWGPMAVAMMGGLFIATALTLIFLPALYASWYRVRRVAA